MPFWSGAFDFAKAAWKGIKKFGRSIGEFFDDIFDSAPDPDHTVLENRSRETIKSYGMSDSGASCAENDYDAQQQQRDVEAQQRARKFEDEERERRRKLEEDEREYNRRVEAEERQRAWEREEKRRKEEEAEERERKKKQEAEERQQNSRKQEDGERQRRRKLDEEEREHKRRVEEEERQRAWKREEEERQRTWKREDEERQRIWKLEEEQRIRRAKEEEGNWRTLANLKFEKERLIKKAMKKLKLNLKEDFNFGFAGPVNCGKSSLVNALRGVKKTDRGYAKVDVTEVTNPITRYEFKDKRLKHLVFWDIPGFGTLRLDMKTYYKENFLYAFDCLFLMIGETNLSNDDAMFARQAKDAETKIAFIKSKCDILVTNHWSDPDAEPRCKTMLDTATYIYATVKENHLQNCPEDLKDIPYFLISSRSIALAYNKVTFNDEEEWRMVFDEMNLSVFMAECAQQRIPQIKDALFKMKLSRDQH